MLIPKKIGEEPIQNKCERIIERYNSSMKSDIISFHYQNPRFINELIEWLENSPESALILREDNIIKAVAVYEQGDYVERDMWLFVGEQYRNNGIGSELLFATLEEMKLVETQKVLCDFARDYITHNFLSQNGFEHYYYSVYMSRETLLSKEEFTSIRHYEDKDYIETFTLASRAFYNMNLSVGLNLKCDELTDKSQKQYSDNSNNLFVLESYGEIVASLRLNENCIEHVAVKVECQRHGYDQKMVKFALSELYRRGYSKCSLWCLVGNPAEYLYKREGFVVEDCYEIMNKSLSNCN